MVLSLPLEGVYSLLWDVSDEDIGHPAISYTVLSK
jgi:hypothetical protein